jgi:RNA methyltransferase, TrmH family
VPDGERVGFHHPLVRAARALRQRKHREERRRFLVDGPTAVEAALRAPRAAIETVFFVEGHARATDVVRLARERGLQALEIDERSMRALSQTQEPQGVVAVAGFVERPIDALRDALPAPPAACVVAVLHAIADPGNAGTLIRSAEALGAAAVAIAGASVDPYNDKVVRSSMGSLFHLPLFVYRSWSELRDAARSSSLALIATAAGADDVRAATIPARCAVVVGNERRGVSDIAPEGFDAIVGIPQKTRSESLNAAVAGSIAFYEIARSIGVLDAATLMKQGT